MAINNNGVTVAFSALTGDIDSATVAVKDPAGNEVAVVAQNLEKGATSATFPFTAAQPSLAAGTWTVDGKEILVKSQDAGLQNLVSNVGIWSADFAKDKLEGGLSGGALGAATYDINVENSVSSVQLTPTAAEGATITATIISTDSPTTPRTQVLTNNAANTITLDPATTAESEASVVITVIAPDAKTSKTYSVDINRAAANASNNAYAATATGITLSGGAVQGYGQDVYNYSENVAAGTPTETISVTAADANAKVYINGELTTAPKSVILAYGANNYEIKIVAEDGTTSKTYNLVINRANPNGSSVNTLNSFTQSVGEVADFTAKGTNATLTTTVPNSATELTITPVATNAKASVFVEPGTGANANLKVEKQGASYVIKGLSTTSPSDNIVDIVVTAEDGTPNTSTLTITRATATASDIANLTNLTVTPTSGELFAASNTTFKSTTTEYSFNVPTTDTAVGAIVPTTTGNATFKVNGVEYANAGAAALAPLKIGANVVEIKVTSENALNSRTYKVTINRADVSASAVKTLKSLTISAGTLQGFEADTAPSSASLTTSVANSVNDLTITPVATHAGAKVTVSAKNTSGADLTVEQSGGNYVVKGLTTGLNPVTISVTPENASTAQVYTLNVTKAGVSANDNANLTNVTVNGGSPLTFGTNQTSVTTNVQFATNTATIVPTEADAGNATVVVKKGGQVVTGAQNLAVGANNFEIEVTAANGTTKKTYTVTVVRSSEGASAQAGLTALTVDKGTYIPTGEVQSNVTSIDTDTGKLYLGSASEFNSVTFTATTADENATIVFNNGTGTSAPTFTENADGTYTVASLDEGDTFDVVVTSPDTTVTYTTTITVDRAASGASPFATLTALTETFTPAATLDAGITQTADDVKVVPATKDYEYFVRNDVDEVTLAKDAADVNKTVTFVLNGKTYASGANLPLAVGKNVVTVNTLAADNVTEDTYTLAINRASSATSTNTAAALKNSTGGTITSGDSINLGATGDAYTFSVTPTDANATVKVTAKDATATPTQAVQVANVDGKYVIDGRATGESTLVTVEVVAADKATKQTYTFTLVTP